MNAAKSAQIVLNSVDYGYISILHPMLKENIDRKLNIVIFEINLTEFLNITPNTVKYLEPSKYPEVRFDLNLLVDKSIDYDKVYTDLKTFDNDLLIDCKFVDLYEGKGIPEDKKSLTFSFVIGSNEKTLSSNEIDNFRSH